MSEFEPVVLSLPPTFFPSLRLEILPLGLTIRRLLVTDDTPYTHVIIGSKLPHGKKHTNPTLGRYTNRVPVGTHNLERHGIHSIFVPLSNENKFVSLNGGPVGFDAVPWTLLSEGDLPRLFSATEVSKLRAWESPVPSHAFFRLISPSGDQGYPGQLVTEALIALIPPTELQDSATAAADDSVGSVVFIFRSSLDEGTTKVVTPVNLTQRWGFNLDANLQGGANETDCISVENHMLTIEADYTAQLGPHRLATRKFIRVSPSHDHRNKKIGEKFPPGGYDDYYAFRNASTIPIRIPLSEFTEETDLLKDVLSPERDGSGAPPVVELSSAKSGFKVFLDTNQQGVMFRTTNIMGIPKNGHAPFTRPFPHEHLTPIFASFEFHQPLFPSPQAPAASPTAPPAHGLFPFHEHLTPISASNADATLLTSAELYHNYVRCDVKFNLPGN